MSNATFLSYEVLSDAEKRRNYDQFGEAGLDSQGGASDATSIFEMFFGGGGGRRGPARSDDAHTTLVFTLEEFFKGAVKNMAISRNVVCLECGGHGGPENAIETCQECNGQVWFDCFIANFVCNRC